MPESKAQASWENKGEGRRLRRARNAVKRYTGAKDLKLVRRLERAQALLLAATLRKS